MEGVVSAEHSGTTVSVTPLLALPQNSYVVISLVSSSGTLTMTRMDTGHSVTLTNPGSTSIPGFYVGSYSSVNTNVLATDNLSIVGDVVYARALISTEQATVADWLNYRLPANAIPPTVAQVVIAGDSIAAGTHADTDSESLNWLTLLMKRYPGTDWYNTGWSGATVSDITGAWSSGGAVQPGPGPLYSSSRTKNMMLYYAGYNSVNASVATATIESQIAAYVTLAKAAGYTVVIGTLMQSGLSGAKDTARLAINTWMLAGSSGADAVADLAGIPSMTYADTIHPNSAGQALTVPVWAAAINSVATLN